MKRLALFTSCLLTCVSTSAIYADQAMTDSQCEIKCEKPQKVKKERECCPVTVCEAESTCTGFFALGDFLYWKSTVTALPTAISGVFTDTDLFDYINDDAVVTPTFGYDPGFRVGLGYEFDAAWDFTTTWSRLHSHGTFKRTIADDSNDVLEGVWFLVPGDIQSMSSNQYLHYDEVNFDFSKTLSIGTHFSLQPYWGPLYARIHQKLNISSSQMVDDLVAFETNHIFNNFSGGGIRLGLESEYTPFKWLSVYGGGSYSLVYGKFKFGKSDVFTIPDANIELTHQEASVQKDVAQAIKVNIGLKGSWSFSDDRFNLIAHIGYELNTWPQQVRINRILSQIFQAFVLPGNGNVSFHGLTTGLELRF